MNRRSLLKMAAGSFAGYALSGISLGSTVEDLRIDKIEIFRYDVKKALHFSFGTWNNRQVAIVKISAGDHVGWAENIASINNPDLNISEWGHFLRDLKGKTIQQALDYVVQNRDSKEWSWKKLELAEICLLDISGRSVGKPAIELLGMQPGHPIPGLFCILEEDPAKAREQAKVSLAHNLKTHCKIKLFGKKDLDLELVRTVREVMGPKAFLTADVNCGYKEWQDLQELAQILRKLNAAGLNACEDPAKLEIPQWVELQKRVGELALIPDAILRPAWQMIDVAVPGMGRIYNLHPGFMGSMSGTVEFGRKIQGWGHGVMIGDNSMIGPSCTAWQQLAIGLGAVWVEALEKPGESVDFLKCVNKQAVARTADGAFGMVPRPGFGLEIDEDQLKAVSSDYVVL